MNIKYAVTKSKCPAQSVNTDWAGQQQQEKKSTTVEAARTFEISKTSVQNIPQIKHCIKFTY